MSIRNPGLCAATVVLGLICTPAFADGMPDAPARQTAATTHKTKHKPGAHTPGKISGCTPAADGTPCPPPPPPPKGPGASKPVKPAH